VAKLICSAITSLDGYIADEHGEFDWGAPDSDQAMKDAADRDLSIGGPALAAHAFRAGLVDEVRPFVSPLTVGGGTPFLPDRLRLSLHLLAERRFGNGVVYLQYRVSP
jgi:riboflavin biosynthesis pyrimidine reductase